MVIAISSQDDQIFRESNYNIYVTSSAGKNNETYIQQHIVSFKKCAFIFNGRKLRGFRHFNRNVIELIL